MDRTVAVRRDDSRWDVELYGRHAEMAVLDELLDQAANGTGSALALWGEPGIGKTALLDYAVGASADATVLRCRGTRMESGLAFAALHELLWPVIDQVAKLAAPQAAALRGALGLSRDPTNRFLVGAAVLSLISDLARRRPVLVVVDDAQWVDEATTRCLGFLARRVAQEPVVVLVTGHEDPASGAWEGLPGLEVLGLAEDDARKLVTEAVPEADEDLLDCTIRAAGGNPLALHELPTIEPDPDDGGPLGPSGAPMPIGPRLRRAFGARVAAMSSPAQTLLLLAAAEDRGDRAVVHRAGTGSGVDAPTWEEVLRSGLLRVTGDRLEFRHPLIRAAVYDGASFLDRQAAHLALATALPADAIGERAWHLAAAADGPDENVAVLLEKAADECLERSAGPMAARMLRRAAELSPSSEAAARRLAIAARAAWGAGRAEAAQHLLEQAETLAGELSIAGVSGGLRGKLEFAHGMPERAHHLLMRDLAEVPEAHRKVELGTLALRAAWSAGKPALVQEALAAVRAVDTDGDAVLAPVLTALRNWWTCYDEASPVPPPRVDLTCHTIDHLTAAAWELLPPVPLVQVWGSEGDLRALLREKATQLRRRHELAALAMMLSQAAVLDLAIGRWNEVEAAVAEALPLAEEIGADHVVTQCHSTLGGLASARGLTHATAEHTAQILRVSAPRGVRALSASAYWQRGRSALFEGRAQEALGYLRCLSEPGHEAAHPTFAIFATLDTVEAAVQAGGHDIVPAQIDVVHEWAERSGATWARLADHCLQALVQGGKEAEASFQAALAVEGASHYPFEYARVRLLYGEWLRRARRRGDAKVQLAAAIEIFARLGAEPLRQRALRELNLSDSQATRSAAGLTAQELRVARLAAERLTNREIGAQLLISPRTVGHHLASIYPKLGIASRADLARIDFEGDLRLGPPA